MPSDLPHPEKLALSRQARSLWGKSDGAEGSRWLPLYMHMLDSVGIAEHLWDEWLPEGTRSFLTEALGGEPRQARKSACFIAGVHDIGKAVLAVELSKWIFPAVPLLGFIAGVACVLGHMFPFYLKFKGGKGFASYLGMILAINWKVALCILAAVVILTVLTDYIVVGTVTSVVSFPIYTAIRSGWLPLVILCVATLAILIKHRENFIRIWNGTEMGLSSAGRGKYKMK